MTMYLEMISTTQVRSFCTFYRILLNILTHLKIVKSRYSTRFRISSLSLIIIQIQLQHSHSQKILRKNVAQPSLPFVCLCTRKVLLMDSATVIDKNIIALNLYSTFGYYLFIFCYYSILHMYHTGSEAVILVVIFSCFVINKNV